MVRDKILYHLARRRRPPPRDASAEAYQQGRDEHLATEFDNFDSETVRQRDVLDFGCGFGHLCFQILEFDPKSVLGIEVEPEAVKRCEAMRPEHPLSDRVRYALGTATSIPADDNSIDTILVMDVLEHVLDPLAIFKEWRRVLRPGGRVLLYWVPFRSPYGAHLNSILPVPWPQILFGERAVFAAAARMYDDPEYVVQPWDLDDDGNKRPNPWRIWQGFRDQEHLNLLNRKDFEKLFAQAGFHVDRWEAKGFRDGPARLVGRALSAIPGVEEFMTPAYIVELVSP